MSAVERVEDRTLEFHLRRDPQCASPDLAAWRGRSFPTHHWRDAFDSRQAALRQEVWACKDALDAIDAATYTATRNKLFPLAVSGSAYHFSNRAGHKLMQCMDSTGVWEYLKEARRGGRNRSRRLAFADVCGGPGAFSQALFAVSRKHQLRLEGFGMTLAGVDGLDWYPELRKHRFTATYALDGSGDIFKLSNIEALASLTGRAGVRLVVADGGFHVDFTVANYQETISARIMYGQWLAALKILTDGGCFVLKLFDSFSPLTRAVLYLSTFVYDRVHIVKPKHSRVVNSERYLVCIGFQGVPEGWMSYFNRCYSEGFAVEDHVPDLLDSSYMHRDEVFMKDLEEMNLLIATNQKTALRMVVDAASAVKAEREATKEAEASPVAAS